MESRLVMQPTDVMADWKCSRMLALSAKRVWKYGAAARNMFLFSVQHLDKVFNADVNAGYILPCP